MRAPTLPSVWSGHRVTAAAALGAYFAAFALGLRLFPEESRWYSLWADITYLPFRLSACWLLWAAAKATTNAGIARGWRFLTAAQLCAIAGNLTWLYSDFSGLEVPNPAYIAWSVPHNALALYGLWTMIRSSGDARERMSDWVDAAVLVVAGALLAWFFEAARIAELEGSDLTWVALFIVDSASNFAITFLAVAVRLRSPAGLSRTAMTRIAVAYGLFALADLVFESQTATDTYQSGSWLDLAYAASVIVVALGADRQRRNPSGDAAAPGRRRLPGDVLVIVAASLALISLLALVARPVVNAHAVSGTVIGIVLLVLLVLWRQRLARAEIEHLVAHRLQLERQLWHAQKMETVGRLTSGVAHDFNNILASISGHAQLLRASVPATEYASAAAIEFAVQRAAALTRRLLAFGSASALEPQPVILGDVVASLEPLLRRLLPADVTPAFTLQDDGMAASLADGQLEQILLNLVINARDAMPRGGKLDIALRRQEVVSGDSRAVRGVAPGTWAHLSVADSGSGMSADTRARLFEPFFTTKPKEQGTGLGLATVSSIVVASGGHIIVKSEPGSGTVMSVLLPLVATATTPEGESDARTSDSPAKQQTSVLVVDDERSIRSAIGRALGRLGYQVTEANDGVAAMATAVVAGGGPHLLITDVRMPRMDGTELARQLRERWPTIPVIFVTGIANPDVGPISGDGTAATLVLAKPFDLTTLVGHARRLIEASGSA